jgi:hypothetical protein
MLKISKTIAAVVLTHSRPDNVQQIIRHLVGFPGGITSIHIVDTGERCKPTWSPIPLHRVRMANKYTLTRYLYIKQMKEDVIYVQDDDCLLHNMGTLKVAFDADPTRIAFALKPKHYEYDVDGDNCYGTMHNALVGWGAFLMREWVEPAIDEYRNTYGGDETLFRKADKIVTMLQRKHHNPILGQIEDLPGAYSEDALYRRDDHHTLNEQVIANCLKLQGSKCTAS